MGGQILASQQWAFYDRQTSLAKTRAMDRLQIVQRVEAMVDAGMTKSGAVGAIASTRVASAASIWAWLKVIDGVGRHDRLAYLVPGFRGGGRRAEVDPAIMDALAADYLRRERPAWIECVRRAAAFATRNGWHLPHGRTLWRRLVRQYGHAAIAMRGGDDLPAWLRVRLPANDR